jgi:hypothetical protein
LGFSNFREYRQHLARQAKEERYFRMNGMTIRDSESLNAMEIEEICSVCLDEIGDGKKRKVAQVYCGTHSQPDENGNTLYGHFFHEECFRQLSERNPVGLQCPNCRKLVDRRPLQQNPDNDDDDDDHFGGDDATVVPQSLENRFDS